MQRGALMNTIVKLSPEQRSELFRETAARKGITNAIAEKDFWVTWVLSKIFSDPHLSTLMIFKGGTSLSKAFHLIERFSEDIDLILDWRTVIDTDPRAPKTKTAQDKLNKEINAKAVSYIQKELLPKIASLITPFCTCIADEKDGLIINVRYPSSFDDPYLRPEILLEIGPLASWLPYGEYTIQSFASEEFPALFTNPICNVKSIVAERTFWEKATILHQEANRPLDKAMLPRYSRHYYDLAMMAQSHVKEVALRDLDLLDTVVAFKQQFYPSAWVNYESAKAGSIKLVPPSKRITELSKDYDAMRSMIFGSYPSLDEIIAVLQSLEAEINQQ